MSKTKLLILLSISLIFIQSCTKTLDSKLKFGLDYISGETDGFNLKNILLVHLESSDLYDKNSELLIKANIEHSQNLYITNVDNTSDRENITSYLTVTVFNQNNNCDIFTFKDHEEQFYLIASTQNFISNNKATEQIKIRNTEALVQNLLFELISLENLSCLNEK